MFVTSERLTVESIFGEGGRFNQKHGEAYEVRASQVALAKFIDHCINAKENFVGEAPCGTGKSYGYLVPAILKCHADRKAGVTDDGQDGDEDEEDGGGPKQSRRTRVVVATANITLQEQLIKKDLPDLKEVLSGIDFSYCLVKGRSNFLCHDKFADAELNLVDQLTDLKEKEIAKKLIQWGRKTTNGDRSETGINVPDSIWEHLTVGDGDCKKRGCEYFEQCFTRQNRRKAAESDIIVVNYNIVLIDLELKSRIGRGILPAYKYVIFDEGHKMEEIARDFFGKEINSYTVRRVSGALKDAAKEMRSDNKESSKFGPSGKMSDTEMDKISTMERLSDEVGVQSQFFFNEVKEYWDKRQPTYTYTPIGERIADPSGFLRVLNEAYNILESFTVRCAGIYGEQHATTIRFQGRAEETEAMIESLKAIINQSEEDYCYWVEVSKGRKFESVKLVMRPISVAPYLKDVVWDQLHSGIIVSATLAEGGSLNAQELSNPQILESGMQDRFQFVMKSVGLPITTKKFICDSPFDFKSNCALIIPTDWPEPTPKNTEDHRRTFLAGIQEAILHAGGRTMVLFTSHAHLKQFYDGCKGTLERHGINVYAQGLGEENRSELGDLFKNNEKSVLLGTSSYWEGVDVPGNSLVLLVIDKLPFPNFQQDPILAALKDRDSERFWSEEYIPRMTIKFKQGIGRLIRKKTDMGLLVVGDKRCYPGPGAKNYAAKVFNSIPSMPLSTSMDSAKAYFDHLRSKGFICD